MRRQAWQTRLETPSDPRPASQSGLTPPPEPCRRSEPSWLRFRHTPRRREPRAGSSGQGASHENAARLLGFDAVSPSRPPVLRSSAPVADPKNMQAQMTLCARNQHDAAGSEPVVPPTTGNLPVGVLPALQRCHQDAAGSERSTGLALAQYSGLACPSSPAPSPVWCRADS